MKKIVSDRSKLDVSKWRSFVLSHPHGNIFQTPDIYELYQATENDIPIIIAVINEKDELEGCLLSVILREYKNVIGSFTARAIVIGGPLVLNDDINVLQLLLNELVKITKKEAIYIQFRNLWEWNTETISAFDKYGFIFEEHLDIIHDLSIDLNEQWNNVHKGRRKNIKKAISGGIDLVEVNTIDEYMKSIELVETTYQRVGLPHPSNHFFMEAFSILKSQKELLKIFNAEDVEGQVIGTRLVLCYKDMIYDWYAGSDAQENAKYPNDFLPWKIFEWGHNNGYSVFDFGGAGKPGVPYGVRDYKLKFGGKLVNYGRFERVNKPLMMKIGKIGICFYKKIKYVRK